MQDQHWNLINRVFRAANSLVILLVSFGARGYVYTKPDQNSPETNWTGLASVYMEVVQMVYMGPLWNWSRMDPKLDQQKAGLVLDPYG